MRFAYRRFYRVFKRLAYVNVPLDAGDFGLIDRRVVDAINSLPEKHRFLRGLRAWVGFKQLGRPLRAARADVRHDDQLAAQEHRLGAPGDRVVLLRAARPDHRAGAARSSCSRRSALIVEVVARLVDPSLAPKGFTTVIVVILFIGGIQLLCLAIIGSYLAHMYEEVKGRPPFIVESILNRPAGRRAADRPAGPELEQRVDRPPERTSERRCQPRLHPTRCAICGNAGPTATSCIRRSSIRRRSRPSVFSARRLPDRMHYRMVRCRTLRARALRSRARRRCAGRAVPGRRRSTTATSSKACGDLRRRPRPARRSARRPADGLLDIGCGSGFVLELARDRGWSNVRGVEPSADAIAKADPAIRSADRPGHHAQRACSTPGSFDAVTLFQVLDHMPDPLGVAARLPAASCAPGGVILALNHNVTALVRADPRRTQPDHRRRAHVPLLARDDAAAVQAGRLRGGRRRAGPQHLLDRLPART